MVKIRLKRIGRRGQAHYRVVVADSTGKRDGKQIADIGFYNPHSETPFNIDIEQAKNWLTKGAQPTDTVAQYLKKAGAYNIQKKKSVLALPKPPKK